jgi:ABC-2 type transport system permease protein
MRPELHFTVADVLVCLPALVLAALLRFLWGYALALLAFWATRADSLLAVQDSLTFLLAGQVAPVALLPGLIEKAALILPFRYMVGFPVEILTGRLASSEIVSGLIIQSLWLALALVAALVIWRRGIRRYEAVGG